MAGKANVLKQLFIQIGLIGAKTAIKDLLKVEKQTDKAGKSAEKAVGKTNRFSDSLTGLGMVAKKTGGLLKSLGGPIMRGLAFGLKGALGSLKLVARGIKAVGSSILRVVEIAAGIQLSNLFSRVGQSIRGFATSSFDLAEEEQTTKEALRQSFRVQGKGSFVDSFLKTIDKLGDKFGVSIVNLARAFRGTLVPINKLARVAEVVAKFGIIRPDKDPEIIARQIGQLLVAGSLEETLKDLAPALRKLKEDERIARGLEVLEKQLKNVSADDNKTFSFRQRQLQLRFNELKRTFGRPILKVLSEIFGELLENNTKANLNDTGTAIAQVIRTFWNAIGGSRLGPIINKADAFLAKGIRLFGIFGKDVFDFFTGAPSAIQQVFFPDLDPDEIGFGDIIGSLGKAFSDVIKEATGGFVELDKISKSVFDFFSKAKTFFTDVINGLTNITSSIDNLDPLNRFKKALGIDTEAVKMSPAELELLKDFGKGVGKNPIDATNDRLLEFQRRGARPERLEEILERQFPRGATPNPNDQGDSGATPNPNDQGSNININVNTKITTQQPANVIRNQLANQMALIGNMGRLA